MKLEFQSKVLSVQMKNSTNIRPLNGFLCMFMRDRIRHPRFSLSIHIHMQLHKYKTLLWIWSCEQLASETLICHSMLYVTNFVSFGIFCPFSICPAQNQFYWHRYRSPVELWPVFKLLNALQYSSFNKINVLRCNAVQLWCTPHETRVR